MNEVPAWASPLVDLMLRGEDFRNDGPFTKNDAEMIRRWSKLAVERGTFDFFRERFVRQLENHLLGSVLAGADPTLYFGAEEA
jgi:hypothetical protein